VHQGMGPGRLGLGNRICSRFVRLDSVMARLFIWKDWALHFGIMGRSTGFQETNESLAMDFFDR
jgi:hypothetical protein